MIIEEVGESTSIHNFINRLLSRKYRVHVGVTGYDTRPRLEGALSRLPVPCIISYADGRPNVEDGICDKAVWLELFRALPDKQKIIFDYYSGIRLVGRISYVYNARTDDVTMVENWDEEEWAPILKDPSGGDA